jgi:hypothetical protein
VPIDVDVALNAELDPIEFTWSSSDVQLYHLGLGAGSDPLSLAELRYLVDDTPQVLPTFATVAATFHATKPPTVQYPGIDIELGKVLHASERVEVPAPLPPSGSARAVMRFTDIWDKGKAAVIWSETTVTAPNGTHLWTQQRSIYARGEGGFGGDRGASASDATPDRAPDLVVAMPILPQQALLYRLCGDRNPLHSDPGFAAAAGTFVSGLPAAENRMRTQAPRTFAALPGIRSAASRSSIVPPCSSTMRPTMARPRPVPFSRVVT